MKYQALMYHFFFVGGVVGGFMGWVGGGWEAGDMLTLPSLFTYIIYICVCNFYLSTGRFIESPSTVCTQQCFKSIYLCIML